MTLCLCVNLGADAVVAAVQEGADVPQVVADGVHRGLVFDVDVDERRDERARQLLPVDHHILETRILHPSLKILEKKQPNKKKKNTKGL